MLELDNHIPLLLLWTLYAWNKIYFFLFYQSLLFGKYKIPYYTLLLSTSIV